METLRKPPKIGIDSMLCIVIIGPSLNEAREQVRKASSRADIVEFRLDQFEFTQISTIKHLQEASSLPVIFTLRKRSHGGGYTGYEEDRLDEIRHLLELQPDYIDLEEDVDPTFYDEVRDVFEKTQIISSYHDFEQTPKDIQSIFDVMQQNPASIYKLAFMANSSLDALRVINFLRYNNKKGHRISAICMGEYGTATRTLGPVFGNKLVFASLSEDLATAPGQLTASELIGRYRFRKSNKETVVLGLIGDPVNRSPSHHTHNYAIKYLGLNAVYIKFNVQPQELHEFLTLAKKLEFKGFSVTMPLKEQVILEFSEESLDAKNIGAINSLRIQDKKIDGVNTDGIGALDAIEEYGIVKGKTVVILGAGGAAKAIAWEALKREARVIVLNRTAEKSAELASSMGCESGSLNDFPQVASRGYDVLVNSTSVGMYSEKARLPIDCSCLLEEKVVLDVIPTWDDTPFLHEARNKHCKIIFGNQMLMNQAVEQFVFWFGDIVDRTEVEKSFDEGFKTL